MYLWIFSFTVTSLETVIGLYGETLKIPCKSGAIKAEDITITKWKYVSHSGGQLCSKCSSRSDTNYCVWSRATPSLSALDHASVPPYDTAWASHAFLWTWSQCHMWETHNKHALLSRTKGRAFQETCWPSRKTRTSQSTPTMNTRTAWEWTKTSACCFLPPSSLTSGLSPAWSWLLKMCWNTQLTS